MIEKRAQDIERAPRRTSRARSPDRKRRAGWHALFVKPCDHQGSFLPIFTMEIAGGQPVSAHACLYQDLLDGASAILSITLVPASWSVHSWQDRYLSTRIRSTGS